MPSKKRVDSDGNPILADSARRAAQAAMLIRLSLQWAQSVHRSTQLRSLNIYPPSASRNGMWLVVAKGWDGGRKVVAFHRSPDFLTTLLGILQKIADCSISWKEDRYSETSEMWLP